MLIVNSHTHTTHLLQDPLSLIQYHQTLVLFLIFSHFALICTKVKVNYRIVPSTLFQTPSIISYHHN